MVDNLNNSRPLDVHVWSDYPEIGSTFDGMIVECCYKDTENCYLAAN